ncbi:TlpA family protein disulfide reductase [Modestobacter sp. SSW1-42]|uniref:TlpA family protein disulfide reductase n=1 Tax=Modestobacter sp. SSW1-42 TaxID=596372 RepID=UPI00398577F7
MSDDVTRRHALGLVGLVALGGLMGCSSSPDDGATEGPGEFDFTSSTPLGQVIPAEERMPAPAFSGELLDESAFDSTSLAGQIAVINFWGSWCAPCRLEMPDFQTVYSDVKDEGVQFLGVDVKDQRQLAQGFVDSIGVDYPSMFDPKGRVAMAFRGFPANVVPTTILIDRSGRVAALYVAAVTEDELRAALDQLLPEGAPR